MLRCSEPAALGRPKPTNDPVILKRVIAAVLHLFRKPTPLLDEAAFQSAFIAELAKAAPTLTVTEQAPVTLVIGDGGTLFLNNAYAAYRQAPDALSNLLRRYVQSCLELSQSAPLEPSGIVPVIKARAWLEELRQATDHDGKPPAGALVTEDLNDELVIVYAEDSANNIRYFSPEVLAETGLNTSNLRTLAVANLRRVLPPVQRHVGPEISMLTAGGDYVSSLLLFDEIWSKTTLGVHGDIIVAVPTRDVVLYADSANPQAVQRLATQAQQLMQQTPYSITATLFIYDKGQFRRYRA